MPSDSPPAEVEVVGFSSCPMTPQPPTVRQADADAASGGSEGDPAEFKGFTDQQLREKINCWRDRHRTLPDGGEKMRIRLRLMEKELSRRHAAGPRKVSCMMTQLGYRLRNLPMGMIPMSSMLLMSSTRTALLANTVQIHLLLHRQRAMARIREQHLLQS